MSLRIALIAHDQKKAAIADWAERHRGELVRHQLVATASTGKVVAARCPELSVLSVKSGPLGGDQQIGAMIASEGLDVLIFFPDPMTPMPHDVDVKALLRLALLYNVPTALNVATADILVTGGGLSSKSSTGCP